METKGRSERSGSRLGHADADAGFDEDVIWFPCVEVEARGVVEVMLPQYWRLVADLVGDAGAELYGGGVYGEGCFEVVVGHGGSPVL